jgi:conjugative transfer signal peptidase TraF
MTRNYWRLARQVAVPCMILWAVVAFWSAWVPYGLMWNVTPSIPTGIYITETFHGQPVKRGDVVCFKYRAPAWAMPYQYAPEGLRFCKPIAGLPGDEVRIDTKTVEVVAEGAVRTSVKQLNFDFKGRPLDTSALVPGVVEQGNFILIAPAHPKSFDSRYLGPIPISAISHRAWPVWVEK